MITLQETTKSFLESTLHTYLVSDDKMTLYGYIINGTTEIWIRQPDIDLWRPSAFICTVKRIFHVFNASNHHCDESTY